MNRRKFLAGTGIASLAVSSSTFEKYWPTLKSELPIPKQVLTSGSQNQYIALTFDDGPKTSRLPRLLDVLRKHSVHGTFFSLGQSIAAYPSLVKRTHAEGHEHANHTWTHDILDCLEKTTTLSGS